MTRLLARLPGLLLGPRPGTTPGAGTRAAPRDRREAAAGRLRAARRTFDRSVAGLRKAALDHVDRQAVASTALRANLDRLAQRLGADA